MPFLKKKLSKEQYDALDDVMKQYYVEKGDNYLLDLEGGNTDNDVDELRRARDRESQEAKELRKKLKEVERQLAEIGGEDARKRADVDALDKSWKDKFSRREQELTDNINRMQSALRKTLIEDKADALATRISTVPKLLSKTIQERLAVDFDGENPILRVLGKDGKVSALTVDDLEKEFVADPELASIIIGSRASGGSAGTDTRSGKSGAIPPKGSGDDPTKLSNEQRAQRLMDRYRREGHVQ